MQSEQRPIWANLAINRIGKVWLLRGWDLQGPGPGLRGVPHHHPGPLPRRRHRVPLQHRSVCCPLQCSKCSTKQCFSVLCVAPRSGSGLPSRLPAVLVLRHRRGPLFPVLVRRMRRQQCTVTITTVSHTVPLEKDRSRGYADREALIKECPWPTLTDLSNSNPSVSN